MELQVVVDTLGGGRVVGIFESAELAAEIKAVEPNYYKLHVLALNRLNHEAVAWTPLPEVNARALASLAAELDRGGESAQRPSPVLYLVAASLTAGRVVGVFDSQVLARRIMDAAPWYDLYALPPDLISPDAHLWLLGEEQQAALQRLGRRGR